MFKSLVEKTESFFSWDMSVFNINIINFCYNIKWIFFNSSNFSAALLDPGFWMFIFCFFFRDHCDPFRDMSANPWSLPSMRSVALKLESPHLILWSSVFLWKKMKSRTWKVSLETGKFLRWEPWTLGLNLVSVQTNFLLLTADSGLHDDEEDSEASRNLFYVKVLSWIFLVNFDFADTEPPLTFSPADVFEPVAGLVGEPLEESLPRPWCCPEDRWWAEGAGEVGCACWSGWASGCCPAGEPWSSFCSGSGPGCSWMVWFWSTGASCLITALMKRARRSCSDWWVKLVPHFKLLPPGRRLLGF